VLARAQHLHRQSKIADDLDERQGRFDRKQLAASLHYTVFET
jgi:hypothetical protein